MGLDGSHGLPGYSGQLPNSMLATSLVTGRDVLLAGSAMEAYRSPDPELQSFRDDVKPDEAVRRLQPNVRVALASQELVAGLQWPTEYRVATATIAVRSDASRAALPPTLEMRRPPDALFQDQLRNVLSYSDLRLERTGEVLSQVVPQTAAWSSIAGLTPERHRYTLELIGAGLHMTMLAVMRMKHAMAVARPMEFSPVVQPMILTPGYTAFPSGHASEAYFVAKFLPQLVYEGLFGLMVDKEARNRRLDKQYASQQSLYRQLHRLAYRVAENRVVAGLHFPLDSLGGQLLGSWLADYAAAACGSSSEFRLGQNGPAGTFLGRWKFEAQGSAYDLTPGLDEELLDEPRRFAGALPRCVAPLDRNPQPGTMSPPQYGSVLAALWRLALLEWR